MSSLRPEVLKELKELPYMEHLNLNLRPVDKIYGLFLELVAAVEKGEEDNFLGSHNFLPNTLAYFKKMGAYLKNKCTIEISSRDPPETFVTLPEITKGQKNRLSDLKNVQGQMEKLVDRQLAFRSTKKSARKSKSMKKTRKSVKKSMKKKVKSIRKAKKSVRK